MWIWIRIAPLLNLYRESAIARMLSQRERPCTVAVKTLLFHHSLSSKTSKMDSKCCSRCHSVLLLTSFLKNVDADPASRKYSACITCREKSRKRPPAQRPRTATPGPVYPLLLYKTNRLQASVQRQTLPIPPIQDQASRPVQPRIQLQPIQPIQHQVLPQPQVPQPIPTVLPQTWPYPELPIQPPVAGFLPAEQWEYLQRFHTAMEEVKMETCSRCKESWFAMDLRETVCHRCFLRDNRGQTPWLMSEENNMVPGEVPAYLPELTQIEEMIIARSHVQMMVYRYRGHQYHYTGHCVSFMQNTVKTVDVLPNLPAELDVVVLRPSDGMVQDDLRYQRQFRSDFRVRKGRIITWLRFLKEHHPDYRYINISSDRIDALPIDDDISSSFTSILDCNVAQESQDQPVPAELPPPNSQSMVPNLNITTTETDMIMLEITGQKRPPSSLPAPSICMTPITF